MTRHYTLGSWRATRRATASQVARLAEAGLLLRGRPRTAEERDAIARATLAAVREREASGRLVRVGPRRYELRPPS